MTFSLPSYSHVSASITHAALATHLCSSSLCDVLLLDFIHHARVLRRLGGDIASGAVVRLAGTGNVVSDRLGKRVVDGAYRGGMRRRGYTLYRAAMKEDQYSGA